MRGNSACINGESGDSTNGPGSNTTLIALGSASVQSSSACALPHAAGCSR
jgi:hypothetical protein